MDLWTEVNAGAGNDRIDAIADATGALISDNYVANIVDGGDGYDHITALAWTELVPVAAP